MKTLLLTLIFLTFVSTAFSCPTNVADGGRTVRSGAGGDGGGSGGGSTDTDQ